MSRLRRSAPSSPGLTRRRCGKGFVYLDIDGNKVAEPECLERLTSLVIPPAWVDVWICPWPNGHIQAMGTDAAGRRQYLYHQAWRLQKDREKFDRALAFGRSLPTLRATVTRDLGTSGLRQRRLLALVIRLMDLGAFRIGGEEYAEENETFGVATLRVRHVSIEGERVVFSYAAKGSIRRTVAVEDPEVRRAVASILRRSRRPKDNLWPGRGEGSGMTSGHRT